MVMNFNYCYPPISMKNICPLPLPMSAMPLMRPSQLYIFRHYRYMLCMYSAHKFVSSKRETRYASPCLLQAGDSIHSESPGQNRFLQLSHVLICNVQNVVYRWWRMKN